MNKEKLFSEFPPVTTEEWEEVIIKDLKGADYGKKLIWKTDEGFNVRPYYRAEDLSDIDYLNTLPDKFPYTRGNAVRNNHWDIVQEVKEENVGQANAIAKAAVAKGAGIIALNVKNVRDVDALSLLLKDIDLEKTGVHFYHSQNYVAFIRLFAEYVETKKYDKTKIKGAIDFDPIIYFLRRTKFYRSQQDDLNEIITLLNLTDSMPHFMVININGIALHNAGATIVQELGYSLGIANEYFAFVASNNIPVDRLAPKTMMTLSVGSNYFMEIAKLRSIRLLWATIVNQYHPACTCSCKLYINTVASTWNKTVYDPYVNMLRSTTEGMSAAIGGADSISLQPFDIAFKQDDEFSRRMSRNVQVILKEESYFEKVVDPSAGSYYIENLTNSIAEQTWLLFQHVEAEGGMIALIRSEEIKREIEKSCRKRDMDIATRKYILLGTNQFPNTNEQMLEKVDKIDSNDSIGLRTYRGAAAFEEIRLATESYAKTHARPKVFLLKIGNLAMRQARAGFITNFFGCAGYQMIETSGYNTADEGVAASLEAAPDMVVICSSDDEYATTGVEIAEKLKKKMPHVPLLVAGNPTESLEALKQAGVDDFIHVRLNVLDSLRAYNQLLLK